jgi:dolichol-phosphate mannosyltransferase
MLSHSANAGEAVHARGGTSRTLTIVVPGFNEEERLARTVAGVLDAAQTRLDAFEIIIVNDGSRDGTGKIADELATRHPQISVIHHSTNHGVGAAYRNALMKAHYPFITLIPGDNAFESSCLPSVFSAVGQAEMIISYRENPNARTPIRRFLSVICTTMLRIATRLPLRDGHSLYVWPVDKARSIDVPLDYRYHLTTLCGLVPRVESYAEMPVQLTPRPDAFSRVLRPNVVFKLGWAVLRILVSNRMSGNAKLPRRVDLTMHAGEAPTT